MRRISSEIEAKIIEMWFDGYLREYISKTLHIGETTVTDIINTLPKSLQMARDIAVAYRKHNMSMADGLEGLNVKVQLADIGVLPEQIPLFVESVKKMCTDSGYKPSHIIQSAMKLTDIEAQSGKEYPAAIEEFETAIRLKKELSKENEEHSEESENLRLETEKKRRERDEALREAKTTPGQLSEFFTLKETFERHGIDIKDAETVSKLFTNAEETGGNVKRLLCLVKKHGSIIRLVSRGEERLRVMQEEIKRVQYEINGQRQLLSQMKQQVEQQASTLQSQQTAFDWWNYQLQQKQSVVTELEKRREGLILWFGKKLGLPQQEIQKLLVHSQYEVVLASVDNALKQYQTRLEANYGELVNAFISFYGN